MCVIVHQPAGKYLTKEDATKLWRTNPDGGGFAYINDDREMVVEKHMEFDPFWRAFERSRSAFPRRSYLLHMRIATHGSVHIDNVHPFRVDDHTVMAHNGILHKVANKIPTGRDITDTQMFIDEVIPRLPEAWLDDEYLADMVDEYIGWSKLMFVTVNPALKYHFYRLGDWVEHEGLYLSNNNGLRATTPSFTTLPSSGKFQHQTPKALPSGRSEYAETSDDWDEWVLYRNQELIDGEPLDDWEYEALIDAMKTERLNMGIVHDIIVIDRKEPKIECFGCLESIDIETAECQCWELVCGGCWVYKAQCWEEQRDCKTGKLFDYESLGDTGKEFVNEGGKYRGQGKDNLQTAIDKVVDGMVSEEAGNTKLN